MSWNFRTMCDSVYEVEVEYAGNENCVDNEIKLSIGDKSFSFKTENTGGWCRYKEIVLGKVRIPYETNALVILDPQIIRGSKVMNIKSVTLLPVIK